MNYIEFETEFLQKTIMLDVNTIQKLFEYWADVATLYLFYHKQSKLQKTNQSYSTMIFIKKWLWWGDKRVKDAKKILKELWLIEDVVKRDEKWKIIGHYVKLNYIKSKKFLNTKIIPSGAETQGVDNSMYGQENTNALSSLNINALSNKDKENSENQKKYYYKDIDLLKKDYKNKYPNIKTYQKTIFKTLIIWLLKIDNKWLTFKKVEDLIERNYEQIKKFYPTMRWLDWGEWGLNIEKMFNWLEQKKIVPKNWKTQTLQFIKR